MDRKFTTFLAMALACVALAAAAAWGQDAPRPGANDRRPATPPFDDRADRPERTPGPGRNPDRPQRGPADPQPPAAWPVGPSFAPGMPYPPRPFPTPSEALEKYDPQLYQLLKDDQELERQTADLAIRWRRAPKEEQPALKKELADAVNKHFDVRQARRRLQLKRLEEELQSLREAIENRDAARQEVVHRRVAELLGVESDLGF